MTQAWVWVVRGTCEVVACVQVLPMCAVQYCASRCLCDMRVCGVCVCEHTVYIVSMCVGCMPAVCTAAVPILCVCGARAACVVCEHERTLALSLSLAYAPSPGPIAQHCKNTH